MTLIALEEPGTDSTVSSPAPFCFYLFGEPAVTLEGSWLPPPPHSAQSLLAALLLYPRLWRREQLAGWLFPDVSEQRGRHRLSHLLWQLRQWLPELPVEVTCETLRLLPERLWLDVEAFRRSAAGPDLASWLAALALYRGDLLESLYDDWLLQEREALYLEYVRLSHRACDALWQRGRLEHLLPPIERLVQREPLDEHALRLLMNTYRALGRRGASLAAYERFVSLALGEMGIVPEPATVALAQAIQSSPHTPARPLSPPDGDGPVEALLRQAREALARGDAATTRQALDHLRAHTDHSPDDARLLEIDLALFLEEHDRAAALLEQIAETGRPLSMRERLRAAQLALGRRDAAVARALASEALMDAHEVADRETELGALLALARAQQQLGHNRRAARSAEHALVVARESGLAYGVARALTLRGTGHFYQGRYQQALTCFHEARSVALEHGLSSDLVAALRGIRTVLTHTNAMIDALAIAEEELSVSRDLGLTRWEAVALEGIALIQGHLGRSADSLRTLARAQELSERRGEPVRIAINQYHQAGNMLYHDDRMALRAAELGRQALTTFRAHNRPGWEATALTIVGYALWVDGQHAAALECFIEAQEISERIGELSFVPELLAYRGLAQLGLEQPAQALALTRRALIALAQGDVSDEVVPEIHYAHAMALAANGQAEQAQSYFALAYQCLLDGAAQIEDEQARQASFHRNPTMRRLMEELRARGIAPPAGAGVQSVRLPAIRGGGPLRIEWTVDAGPSDAALKRAEGAIALRRVRLARLREEARAQGAAPSVANLAQALGVSERTVQRDLAATRRHR